MERPAQQMANLRKLATQSKKAQEKQVRQSSIIGQVHVISGRVLVDGAGEASVRVFFPATYTERPTFTFGAQLDENQEVVDGSFPFANACVLRYLYPENDIDRNRIIGCDLGVVTFGSSAQRIFIDYRFEGKALVNPVAASGQDDGAQVI